MDELERLQGSRGKFLAAAGLTGAALASGAWRSRAAGAAGVPRAYSAGYFALELDGASCGYLRSVEGGEVVGEVVTEPGSATYFQKKHIGGVRYEEFAVDLGTGMAKPVYDWIRDSLEGKYPRRDGAVVAADAKRQAVERREFRGALVTQVRIPAADASSRAAGALTVVFAPDSIEYAPSSEKLPAISKLDQKAWVPANFRLDIPGLETTGVTRVDEIVIRQSEAADGPGDAPGDARVPMREPGKLEFPAMTVTLTEASAASWIAWHRDFVVGGANDESKERTGTLVFLAPNRQDELLKVHFHGLGIVRVGREKAEPNEAARRVLKAELYCERIGVEPLGIAVTPT